MISQVKDMKKLSRWGKVLGLVGSLILTSSFGTNLKAIALPEADILKALQVPVFTIADDQGVPLIAVVDNNQKVTGVFISQKDAQEFFQQLQKDNPDVAKQVKVQTVSLGQVYKLQASQKQPDGLLVSFVPVESEVELAKKLLTEQGQKYEGGVPLFVAKAGKDQGFLTISQNNEQVIPFFFEKAPLLTMIERFKKEKPDLASTVKIEMIALESVIATLEQSNDEMLKKIVLVPTQETIEFVRTNVTSQQNAPAPNKK